MISATERNAASLKAASLFQTNDLFLRNKNIACYYATDNEFDCGPIIELILNANKVCYLPTLSIYNNKKLEFSLFGKDSPVQKNRFQIVEPMFASKIPPQSLDLVIFPLVGFDLQGHRLGMGGGYYDRTFQAVKQNHSPFFLGLGYDIQKVECLPKDAWDIQLDGVLTERELYMFGK